MAKRKKKYTRTGEFINSAGMVFTVRGIEPGLFEKMRAAQKDAWHEAEREMLDIPTYTTGAGEVVDWDEESVRMDGTPEEIQEWEDYANCVDEFEREYNIKRSKLCFMRVMDNPMEDQEWLDDLEIAEIPLPEDQKELKQLYGKTRVLAGTGVEVANDLSRLIIRIQTLSGRIDDRVSKALEDSFLRELERRAAGSTDRSDTEQGGVEGEQTIQTTKGGS
jgi:hypothetical protein